MKTKTKPHNRETKSTLLHLHVAYQNESTRELLPNGSSNPGIWTRNLAVSKKRRSRNLGGMVVQGLKVQSSGCEPVYLTVRRPNFPFDLAFFPKLMRRSAEYKYVMTRLICGLDHFAKY